MAERTLKEKDPNIKAIRQKEGGNELIPLSIYGHVIITRNETRQIASGNEVIEWCLNMTEDVMDIGGCCYRSKEATSGKVRHGKVVSCIPHLTGLIEMPILLLLFTLPFSSLL